MTPVRKTRPPPPDVPVTATYAPQPRTRGDLVDLLLELLDARTKSGR